ncbi:MAG: hypothetical protein E3J64_00745 [Anaerolineales bacterium]|nr:MAG: hypothetical protein E3J64_00745 [Anaerolineales bacterium]
MRCVRCDERPAGGRATPNYYAADLAAMAVGVISSWQVLKDTRECDRKRELAKVFIADVMPRIRGRVTALHASDLAPMEAKDVLLAESF